MKFPPRSTICAETVRLTDLMATCAAIVNARLPNDAGEDSASILPLLLSGKPMKPTHEAVVHQSEGGFLAIRQGNWKLVCDQTPANGESRKRGQRNQISQPRRTYAAMVSAMDDTVGAVMENCVRPVSRSGKTREPERKT
ncbi:MAG: hypothetical protein L0387_25565 [Acidobacteria bacterium]|nr:hypothetical protein [Acidobacteriota bacterium]MCI0722770.1 hypothetical protein [Acidobacteriota bacterium]